MPLLKIGFFGAGVLLFVLSGTSNEILAACQRLRVYVVDSDCASDSPSSRFD